KRTARNKRSGSASKTSALTARTSCASRSSRPPKGSTWWSPPARGRAIALIVKSRVARSSSIGPRSGVKSTVRPSGSATRQPPWPRDARPIADQRNGRARLEPHGELDGEGLQRGGASDPRPLARHEHVRAGEVATEAVAVADRDEPDPGRPVGDERAAVAGA